VRLESKHTVAQGALGRAWARCTLTWVHFHRHSGNIWGSMCLLKLHISPLHNCANANQEGCLQRRACPCACIHVAMRPSAAPRMSGAADSMHGCPSSTLARVRGTAGLSADLTDKEVTHRERYTCSGGRKNKASHAASWGTAGKPTLGQPCWNKAQRARMARRGTCCQKEGRETWRWWRSRSLAASMA